MFSLFFILSVIAQIKQRTCLNEKCYFFFDCKAVGNTNAFITIIQASFSPLKMILREGLVECRRQIFQLTKSLNIKSSTIAKHE